jgi:hypothetical protein
LVVTAPRYPLALPAAPGQRTQTHLIFSDSNYCVETDGPSQSVKVEVSVLGASDYKPPVPRIEWEQRRRALLPFSFRRVPPNDGTIALWLRRFRFLRSQRCIRTRPARLTPRVAYYHWFAIDTFVDDWTSARERDSVFRENLMAELPRIARIHADDRFIEQLVVAAEQLRDRLATADFREHLVARCTAHEFIIHTALDQIIDTLNDAPEILLFDGIDTELPVSANDSDVERFRDRLLEDAELEMLFDQSSTASNPINSSGPK